MKYRFYNRYQGLIVNGQQKLIPYVKIPAKTTDKVYIYRSGISRLDKISQSFYGAPYYGWLILQANPEYGGSEIDIPNNAILKIPFPLQSSLLDYKTAVQNYYVYYGQ